MICVSLLWVSFVAITGVLTLLGKKNPNRHLTLSRTLLLDTLVGHSTRHSCGTFTLCLTGLLDTCIWHGFWRAYYLALLLGTLAWHSCGMLIFDTFVGRSYLALFWDTLTWHSDLTRLLTWHMCMQDTLTWQSQETLYLTRLLDTFGAPAIESLRQPCLSKSVPQKCRAIVSSKRAR